VFGLGFERLLVLGVVALLVLGPERLPAAAAWVGRAVRQIKDFTRDANEQLRSELGPEFDQLHGPLQDLRTELGTDLNAWRNPRDAAMHHLFTDPSTPTTGTSGGWQPTPGLPGGLDRPAQRPLRPGEHPPVDLDAT
jgi:sec-independent protein translocase protein TatB